VHVFLDANVLFSAARSDSSIRRVLREPVRNEHLCIADGNVWEEAQRNLAVRTAEGLGSLDEIASLIDLHSGFAGSGVDVGDTTLPDKDVPVVASALALVCDVLVTGDRTHFGSLYGATIRGVTIHSPRSLAELMQTGAQDS